MRVLLLEKNIFIYCIVDDGLHKFDCFTVNSYLVKFNPINIYTGIYFTSTIVIFYDIYSVDMRQDIIH